MREFIFDISTKMILLLAFSILLPIIAIHLLYFRIKYGKMPET